MKRHSFNFLRGTTYLDIYHDCIKNGERRRKLHKLFVRQLESPEKARVTDRIN